MFSGIKSPYRDYECGYLYHRCVASWFLFQSSVKTASRLSFSLSNHAISSFFGKFFKKWFTQLSRKGNGKHPASHSLIYASNEPCLALSVAIFQQELMRLDVNPCQRLKDVQIGHRCDSGSWRTSGRFTFENEMARYDCATFDWLSSLYLSAPWVLTGITGINSRIQKRTYYILAKIFWKWAGRMTSHHFKICVDVTLLC